MSHIGEPDIVERDGQRWLLGTDETVAWIERNTCSGLAITSAIPPSFDQYATITELSDREWDKRPTKPQKRLVEVLRHHGEARWWLGFLDTRSADVVFPLVRRLKLYAGWPYVVVQAGPDQALSWRNSLPDLIFPVDRSWCLSTLWDDTWTCLGGPPPLIQQLAADPVIHLRRVGLDEDATPPGHVAI